MIGQKIRKAREAAGISQFKLAVALGVTDTTIGNWERGTSPPDYVKVKAAAEAMGLTVAELEAIEVPEPVETGA